ERAREAARRGAFPTAATGESGGGAGAGVSIAALFLAIVGLAIASRSRSASNRTVDVQPFDETPYRLNPLLPVSPGNVIVQHGETFYWTCAAEALGPIQDRSYVRGSRGVSLRVMRGVTIHSGGSRGRYVDNVRFGVVATGTLMLSNCRLLFIAASGGVAFIGYQRIVSVEPMDTGVRVLIDHGDPQTYATGTPAAAIVLRRLMNGDFADHRAQSEDVAALSPIYKESS
ncbi:MAG: hypothetical protein M3N13_01270, partial [Candidatus Eremiobacteraeota bacterium]|nr:hypothetical protein [Candidatus Eremiobacteraeota bacterium]